ncbi:hypothetical protein BC628DRAFT_853166 [Trametes gibbosa]|nr:hypothetical protein BC628DRAFT_853166 [Trametes gibbosa]
MIIYDYILCLGREYQYVWHSSKSRASRLLYLLLRYTSFLSDVIAFATISPASDTLHSGCLEQRLLGDSRPPRARRTYVLSGKNKVLCGVALILGLGPFLVNVSTLYQAPPINLPPPENCTVTICARTCAILTDVIAIVVTWRATRRSHRVLGESFRRPSLEHILWKNGNVYFITLLSFNVVDVILDALSITTPIDSDNYVAIFRETITTILSCRFLLDLYETNARLERGGSSVSQSLADHSLHFTGLGSQEADAPGEGSAFLDSFGSSVYYSFDDDDDDMEDAERVDGEPEAGPSDSEDPEQTTTRTTAAAPAVPIAGPSSAV